MDYSHSFNKNNYSEPINADYADSLIDNKKYDEAIAYITQFSSTDAAERNRMLACVNSLKLAKAKQATLAKSLTPQQMSAFNFADMILNPGATDAIRYKKDSSGHDVYNSDEEFARDNPIVAKFRKAKQGIGSEIDYSEDPYLFGNFNKTASMVQITIPKHKEGLFGWDWLYKDNNHKDDILNTVYTMTGLTSQDLINKGVKFTETDNGDFEVYFNKNTNEGTALMIAIGKTAAQYRQENNLPIVQGFDSNGTPLSTTHIEPQQYYTQDNYMRHVVGTRNIEVDNKRFNAMFLKDLADAYDEAQETKQYITANRDDEDFLHTSSSTVFSIPALQQDEVKKSFIDNMKGNLHYGDTDFYGYLTDDNGDHLIPFDEAEFRKFRRMMQGRNANQIHIQGMTVNGITGVLITLDPKVDKDGNEISTSRVAKMFIPNYAPQYTEVAINNSTDLQATMHVSNMKNYGVNYEYTFDDGTRAFIDATGAVRRINTKGEEFIDIDFDSQHRLTRDINKDLILQQADMHISQYLNANGTFNMESVKRDAKAIAMAAGEELYPEIPLKTTSGEPITMSDIFGENGISMDNIDETCSRPVVEKINEIFDIFDSIIGKTKHK